MSGVAELSDDLVAAAADGDGEARRHVLALLEPRVRLMVAARLSPTPAQLPELEDIAQEVFVVLTEHFGELRNRTRDGLTAWVSGVVTRLVASGLRQRTPDLPSPRRPNSLDSIVVALSQVGPLWEFLSSSGTTPSGAAARAELVERLLIALGRLKPEYRTALALRIFDDLKIATVADQMGISPAAASMLVIRALKALRREVLRATNGGQADGEESGRHRG